MRMFSVQTLTASLAAASLSAGAGVAWSAPATPAASQTKTRIEKLELQPAVGPVSATSQGSSGNARSITLEEALQIALKNATSVNKADNNLQLSGAQVLQSYAQFLPNLTGTAAYGKYWGKTFQTVPKPGVLQTSNQGANFQLGTSVNLFNGFADQAGLHASLARQSAAEMTLGRAKQQIAIDITQAYLQVILDQRLVEIAKQSLSSSQRREELLKEQTKLGVKDIGNLYTQEAQTATDETAVVSAGNRLQSDIMRLLQRLKLSDQVFAFQPPKLIEVAPYGDQVKDDELVKKALDLRQDLKAAHDISHAADEGVKVAAAGYYPRLDLGLTAFDVTRTIQSQSVSGVDQGPFAQDPFAKQVREHINYAAVATVSWNIFDRQVTRLAVARAETEAANSRLDEGDLRLTVLTEVKQAREDFRGASSRLATARRGVVAAGKSFERIEARYGIGAATFLDLTTAQVVLAQAQSSEAQAQVDVHLQAQVLAHVVGETHQL